MNVIHAAARQIELGFDVAGNDTGILPVPGLCPRHGYVRDLVRGHRRARYKGQLLAEIDVPELDQQLNQARAMLKQAETNLALAKVTAPRYQELIKTNSVSQQEVDQNNQNLAAQEANVQAATAAVSRLEQMQGFEKIMAPFDGVITERKTDFGDLVNAGNAGVGHELFRISQNNVVRIFVNVPGGIQQPSEAGKEGVPGGDLAPESPFRCVGNTNRGRHRCRLSHTYGRTRSSRILQVNCCLELTPICNFNFRSKFVALALPASAILFQADGPQVGVVNQSESSRASKR